MISLQFSARDDLASAVIEWFGHGVVSHVDVVQSDGTLVGARSDKLDGVPAGVQARPANYCTFSRIVRVDLPTDIATQTAFDAFISAQIGKPYDEKAIVAFIPGRNWRNPDAWFCSELVAAALEASSWLRTALTTPMNKITPPDLLLVLSALVPVKL
jgi:hypothetical protein